MGSVGANKGTVNNGNQTSLDRALGIQNNNMTSLDREREARAANRATRISQAKFEDLGGGNWQMDIPDIGGGQVLDETGSTRAYREGFMPNAKVYSASAWTYDENGTPTVTDLGTFNRRNQAQTAIRNLLKGNRRI